MVMDVKTKEIYMDETFWVSAAGAAAFILFFFQNIFLAILVFTLICLSPLILPKLFSRIKEKQLETEIVEQYNDGILLGYTPEKKPIRVDLETLNHVFIIGITRYGKTRLVMSLIKEIIENYSSKEVKLAFSDAKAVSFNVFARSQHLFAPLATSPDTTERLIELVLEEMNERKALFQEYHEQICTNIDEYERLSGEKLPRIVLIFDEVADSIQMNSQAERNLTTLAKMGLAYGINLILITQRPTKVGISHEITSQCQTIFCTYMRNQTEYGSVAKIPSSIYNEMSPEKGLFMIFNPELAPVFLKTKPEYQGWGFIKSNYVENEQIVATAVRDSTQNLSLPSLESTIPAWAGSEEDKLMAIEALENKLGVATIEDMVKYFNVSRRTAKTWLKKYNE